MSEMIGRLHHVVLDCPNPRLLAQFYSALLGDPITYDSDDWVVVRPVRKRPVWRSSWRLTKERPPGRIHPCRSRRMLTSWSKT